MATRGTVRISQVWKMLNRCAPGHERTLKTHHWSVKYRGKTYPWLPKGPGRHQVFEVWTGKVEQLVDVLDIDLDCARRYVPQLPRC